MPSDFLCNTFFKRDNIIFDLLTVIILFTPRSGMIEYEKVRYASSFLHTSFRYDFTSS